MMLNRLPAGTTGDLESGGSVLLTPFDAACGTQAPLLSSELSPGRLSGLRRFFRHSLNSSFDTHIWCEAPVIRHSRQPRVSCAHVHELRDPSTPTRGGFLATRGNV